jgi:PEP-CTERM motif-containing protein
MKATFARLHTIIAFVASLALVAQLAHADPLPGRDLLKFSQKPMIQTNILGNNGTIQPYFGHDELSTAYGFVNPQTNSIPQYQGKFMADDFADKLTSPIVHVKWWGSYSHDFINLPVNQFLISFETDVPAGPAPSFSRPGQPLLNQVVTKGPLAPGSGTYTEKLIRGPDPILGESLYEYNAELNLTQAFPEIKDTIYWLKIAALVDVPSTLAIFDPYNPQNSPIQVTQWGWHNRDYTIQDPLASTGLPFPPGGEFQDGQVGPAVAPTPVWHFQDDAVTGDVRILPGAAGFTQPVVFQPFQNMLPTNYLDNIDGPSGAVPGQTGIGFHSKDLAFELYTTVPEPTTCLLMAVGIVGVFATRRRSRIV